MASRDPFAEIRPGDRLDGLPAPAWNAFLKIVTPGTGGGRSRSRRPTNTVVLIRNDTGADLAEFQVVKVGDVVNDLTADDYQYAYEDFFKGLEPAEGVWFAITQEAIPVDGVGLAMVLGVTTCTLHLIDEADTHASPTSSVADLTTGTSGPALILWRDPDAVADDEGVAAKVLITQQEAAGASGSASIVATFQPTPNQTVASGGSHTYTSALSLAPGLYLVTGTVQILGNGVSGNLGFAQLQGGTGQNSPRFYWTESFSSGRVSAVISWVLEVTGSTENFDLFVFSDGGGFTIELGTSTTGTTIRTTKLS